MIGYLTRPPASKPALAVDPNKKQLTLSVPAPIGGLNARDPINAMPETDAYALVNWIPTAVGLQSRNGYMAWTSGLTAPIQSLFSYFIDTSNVPTSLNYATFPATLPGRTFAATKDAIFEITNKGAVGGAVFTLTGAALSGQLYTNMFANAAGKFMVFNSEADGYHTFDGTTWLRVTLGAGANQVANVNPNNLVFNLPWKNRLWFVERNSTNLWYLPTGAVYGAATQFNVGPFLKQGGAIAYIANWTMDAGSGIDDHFVIVTDKGEVLVYKGTDPASASTFALVGSWSIGEVPKGRRAFCQYGGDLLLLSTGGLFPLSYVTRGGTGLLKATEKEYTSKIQKMINEDLGTSFNQYGWEVTFAYRDNLIIITVPNTSSSQSKQYALSTVTNQWALLAGLPMSTIGVFSGWTMFGTSNEGVKLMFGGTDTADVNGANGTAVVGVIMPAFTYFGNPNAFKHFLMVRPTFISDSPPGLNLQMNTDFNTDTPVQGAVFNSAAVSRWDVAKWDVNKWGGAQTPFASWYSVSGAGYAATLAMTTTTVSKTTMASIQYMMEVGGAI